MTDFDRHVLMRLIESYEEISKEIDNLFANTQRAVIEELLSRKNTIENMIRDYVRRFTSIIKPDISIIELKDKLYSRAR